MKLALFTKPTMENVGYTLDPFMLTAEVKAADKNKPSWVPKKQNFTNGVHKLIGGNCYYMSPSYTAVVAVWNGEIFVENNPTIHVFKLIKDSDQAEPEVVLKEVYTGASALAYKEGSTQFSATEGAATFGDAEIRAQKIAEYSIRLREEKNNKKLGLPQHMRNQPDWIKERYCQKRNIEVL